MRKVGKKNWWIPLRPKLKVAFERAGIMTCELRMARCAGALFLGFAHSRKRRNITTNEQRAEVALLCVNCHCYAESMPALKMEALIRDIIAKREVQPVYANLP